MYLSKNVSIVKQFSVLQNLIQSENLDAAIMFLRFVAVGAFHKAGYRTSQIFVDQTFVKPAIIVTMIFIIHESSLGSRNYIIKAKIFKKTSVQSKDLCLLCQNRDICEIRFKLIRTLVAFVTSL